MYLRPVILSLALVASHALLLDATAQVISDHTTRVVVEHEGWQLIGDFYVPPTEGAYPAVLMVNQAAGDRTVYHELAQHLAARGIASLRIDLRGHGESINLGRFVPGEHPRSPLIWNAEADVAAAHAFLRSQPRIDHERIGIVGASYSGEEMAEAGRMHGYAQTYAVLSPGSFSEASILGIDTSEATWLFITAKDDAYLQDITAAVQMQSQTAEIIIIPGTAHATNILAARPTMAERIAIWLTEQLQ